MATLYRCRLPGDRLCACGKVARELRRQGFEFDEVRVAWLRRDRDEVQGLSGQRVVPLLVTDEATICDSRRIVEHLRRRSASAEPAGSPVEEPVADEPVSDELFPQEPRPGGPVMGDPAEDEVSAAAEVAVEVEPVAAGQLVIDYFQPAGRTSTVGPGIGEEAPRESKDGSPASGAGIHAGSTSEAPVVISVLHYSGRKARTPIRPQPGAGAGREREAVDAEGTPEERTSPRGNEPRQPPR